MESPVFELPPSLARHFRDRSGRVDFRALLRTPDDRLIAPARRMPEAEWADLYARLRRLRLGLVGELAARAAGVDVEAQRRRFLRVLEAAASAAPA
jgi:hypothetical protein